MKYPALCYIYLRPYDEGMPVANTRDEVKDIMAREVLDDVWVTFQGAGDAYFEMDFKRGDICGVEDEIPDNDDAAFEGEWPH